MDTDINLFLVEENAQRFTLALPDRRELAESRSRLVEQDQDESFIEDNRGSLRPAQQVERKLVAMLQSSAVLVSHLQKVNRPHPR